MGQGFQLRCFCLIPNTFELVLHQVLHGCQHQLRSVIVLGKTFESTDKTQQLLLFEGLVGWEIHPFGLCDELGVSQVGLGGIDGSDHLLLPLDELLEPLFVLVEDRVSSNIREVLQSESGDQYL